MAPWMAWGILLVVVPAVAGLCARMAQITNQNLQSSAFSELLNRDRVLALFGYRDRPRLRVYLTLNLLVDELEQAKDPLATVVRDAMIQVSEKLEQADLDVVCKVVVTGTNARSCT